MSETDEVPNLVLFGLPTSLAGLGGSAGLTFYNIDDLMKKPVVTTPTDIAKIILYAQELEKEKFILLHEATTKSAFSVFWRNDIFNANCASIRKGSKSNIEIVDTFDRSEDKEEEEENEKLSNSAR